MGARIKKEHNFTKQTYIHSILSPKLFAQCILKVWKNFTTLHNTHFVCVSWETFWITSW